LGVGLKIEFLGRLEIFRVYRDFILLGQVKKCVCVCDRSLTVLWYPADEISQPCGPWFDHVLIQFVNLKAVQIGRLQCTHPHFSYLV